MLLGEIVLVRFIIYFILFINTKLKHGFANVLDLVEADVQLFYNYP